MIKFFGFTIYASICKGVTIIFDYATEWLEFKENISHLFVNQFGRVCGQEACTRKHHENKILEM